MNIKNKILMVASAASLLLASSAMAQVFPDILPDIDPGDSTDPLFLPRSISAQDIEDGARIYFCHPQGAVVYKVGSNGVGDINDPVGAASISVARNGNLPGNSPLLLEHNRTTWMDSNLVGFVESQSPLDPNPTIVLTALRAQTQGGAPVASFFSVERRDDGANYEPCHQDVILRNVFHPVAYSLEDSVDQPLSITIQFRAINAADGTVASPYFEDFDNDQDGVSNNGVDGLTDTCPDNKNPYQQQDVDDCAAVPALAVADVDADGINDDVDNCLLISNPDQTNTDGDDLGDICDADDDNDGIIDARNGQNIDNCPLVANADQTDTDGDGTGDACDDTDDRPDSDGDGIVDVEDNCPNIANPDQDPNACGVAILDTDGDTIPDDIDNCPLVANVNQADTDANGVGDACQAGGEAEDGSGGCSLNTASQVNGMFAWIFLIPALVGLSLRRRK